MQALESKVLVRNNENGFNRPNISFVLSHLHYDHIQGLPFFAPAYIHGNKIVFHGGHDDLETHLRNQMKDHFSY